MCGWLSWATARASRRKRSSWSESDGDLAVQELDRHAALEVGVERAIDRRHPSRADLGVEPVAAAQLHAHERAHEVVSIVADVRAGSLTIFTDPYCPWSWAAEPHLRRLEVEFGDQVRPSFVIVGLHRKIERPERLALAALDAAAESGMPVDARVFLRDPPASTHPAGLAVQAVSEQAGGERVGAFLRRLREAILLEGRRMDTRAGAAGRRARDRRAGPRAPARGLRLQRDRRGVRRGHRARPGRRRRPPRARHRARAHSLAGGPRRGRHGPRRLRLRPVRALARRAGGRRAGRRPAARPGVEDALRRWGTLATPEVAAACELPGPRAPAELWRLATEWRVRARTVPGGGDVGAGVRPG